MIKKYLLISSRERASGVYQSSPGNKKNSVRLISMTILKGSSSVMLIHQFLSRFSTTYVSIVEGVGL